MKISVKVVVLVLVIVVIVVAERHAASALHAPAGPTGASIFGRR
jgi:hypothetical protein